MFDRIGKSLKNLFPRQPDSDVATLNYEPSKDTARRRLQLVLVQDRMGLSQDVLEALKNDLLKVIAKHLVVHQDAVDVQITRTGDSVILKGNFRVGEARTSSATNVG
jgi:cell division topological specificity factor